MKCKITLNYGENALDKYECFGELQFEKGGFSLDYEFVGDKCLLTYDGKILKQTRRGKMQIDMTFAVGEKTVCFTEDTLLGYRCQLNTETRGIEYSETQSGIALEISYAVEGNPIVLKLTAEYEEKL